MHRLRLKFGRGEQLKFLSHLDLMRLWERSLRRAGIELSYSEGFSPHPRISLAAPLAVGVTSIAELMDIFLEGRITASLFVQKVGAQLPGGLDIIEILPVGIDAPSLQSRLRFAEYAVVVKTTDSAEASGDGNISAAGQRDFALAPRQGYGGKVLRPAAFDRRTVAGREKR